MLYWTGGTEEGKNKGAGEKKKLSFLKSQHRSTGEIIIASF